MWAAPGGFPQAATMAKHGLPHVLGEVAPQMPAVSGLDRLRRAGAGAVGVGAGPVTGDHDGAGMLLEPGGQRPRLPILEQVDGPTENAEGNQSQGECSG